MIIEFLSGHLMAGVAVGFVDSLRSASENGLLQHSWAAQFFVLKSNRKEKGVFANLTFRKNENGVLVPAEKCCRIVFAPVGQGRCVCNFSVAPCSCSYVLGAVTHPKKVIGCSGYEKDFDTAINVFRRELSKREQKVAVYEMERRNTSRPVVL